MTNAASVTPTTSGRAAIALALRTLGCKHGDRVLVPTYHCPTMVAPIVALGGEPVFYPIDEAGSPQLSTLEAQLKHGAIAVIVPHYFGLPRPMRAIRTLCDRYGAALIEDCAHAFFGRIEGRTIGAWGDFAIASLTKFFPVTEGGCLIQNRPHPALLKLGARGFSDSIKVIADAIELGVIHQRIRGLNLILGPLYRAKYKLRGQALRTQAPPPPTPDLDASVKQAKFDFAADALPFRRIASSAWRLVKLGGAGRIVARRQSRFNWLAERLARLQGARPLCTNAGDNAAPYVFPLWVDDPERVYQKIRLSGVPVFRWDDRWPGTPSLPGDVGGTWSHHVFQIGCHQDLTSSDLSWIADTLESIIDGKQG
ncbi:DegT/DnrJ/EryC1/StrS family aminotransferase [Niveibacterium sp. 24ML]|uniref:DegT/DnrJ/EryC1/StrS family aminotransferase n=1 Tax=Niveibacterium sp. 24ML TaxID=2985512 RepID=UPI002B4BB4A9|nr:DegT/DnrJ/EryC1/StrS family aminotransferase [Niveibacterium sp. 24ML]